MKLSFVKLSPTRNITILVADPLPRELHAAIAERLMDGECVGGEQVGFIEAAEMSGARARLQMMGGEFCGNAAMCIASLAAREDGIVTGETRTLPIEISGADDVLECRVECTEDGFGCRVRMPLPMSISPMEGFTVVRLPGIAHAVVECTSPDELRPRAEAMLRDIAKDIDEDAVGLMLYSPEKSSLMPLVYVRSTDTMVWERGCGSGSAAIGAYAAWKRGGTARVSLTQPGGTITAEAECSGEKIKALSIEGRVRIVCEGYAYI